MSLYFDQENESFIPLEKHTKNEVTAVRRIVNKDGLLVRTEMYSYKLSVKSIGVAIMAFVVLYTLNAVYKQPLLDYTMSQGGTVWLQKVVPVLWIKGFATVSDYGGGFEVEALICLCFLFGGRTKFFYYLFMMALNKSLINYLKLAEANPRPYMVDTDIIPY